MDATIIGVAAEAVADALPGELLLLSVAIVVYGEDSDVIQVHGREVATMAVWGEP